jgi:hypothetical protein
MSTFRFGWSILRRFVLVQRLRLAPLLRLIGRSWLVRMLQAIWT